MRLVRFGLAVLSLWLSAGLAVANTFSFAGVFNQDDHLEVFVFTASSDVIVRTWSYAGGTNAAGTQITAGGFDPMLSLFDGPLPSSNLIASNDNGASVAVDLTTGNAFDSFIELTTLIPGNTYIAVLSQADNFANGPTYADGFHEQGNGNFTPGLFGCGAIAFCDATPAARNGTYAVDFIGVGSASDLANATPEPGTLFVFGSGIAGLGLLRRRRRTG
jgi:PEP-CTERM motif